LKIADINLSLMQILASDINREYVLKQMLICTVKANNLKLTTLAVIDTDYTSSNKSNNHTITSMTLPSNY
jgi:hypothetical protein